MNKYWALAQARMDVISLRERVIVFSAFVLIAILAIDNFMLEPLMLRQKAAVEKLAQQQKQESLLQASLQELQKAKAEEQHSPLHERIALLKSELEQSERALQARRDGMIAPDEMAGLLERVLHNNQLDLVELKTLPVSVLSDIPASGGESAAPKIYKHSVKIVVRGSYPALYRYLVALEKLPEQMFWGDMDLTVEKYPDVQISLTLYTLSQDKVWLRI
jgi:MSHA biogenesis protein MshJ